MHARALVSACRRFGPLVMVVALAMVLGACAGWWPPAGKESTHAGVDERRLAAYLGKYVLITLTYYDEEGDVVTQQQVHGIIVKADRARGFAVALQGVWEGETMWLPPDVRGFSPARRGEYRLHTTSEIIYDPDLLSTWEITRPVPWL